MSKRTTKTARLMGAVVLCLTMGRAASAQDVLTVSGVVTTRADGVAVPGAVVSVTGAAATATTDASGRYALKVPRTAQQNERIQLRITAPGLQPKSIEVVVTGQTITADVALVIDFSTQITVGSRAAGAAGDKAVPVDVISREEIASSGYTETAQVIQSLAPSLNFPRPSITDGTDTVRPATLRGLARSGAGARQRQATAPKRARAYQ